MTEQVSSVTEISQTAAMSVEQDRVAEAAGQVDGLRREQTLAVVTVGVPTVGTVYALLRARRRAPDLLDAATFSVMYFVTAIGVETGMHRYFTHRSFAAHPVVESALAVSGSMAAQGPVTFWVSTHRKHHVFADRDGDPHSPRPLGPGVGGRLRGFWHGHVGWLFQRQDTEILKYGKDVVENRQLMFYNQQYLSWIALGLILPAISIGLTRRSLSGVLDGLLWGGLVRIFALDHATWAVNSLGHMVGSRPNGTRDSSRNIATLAPPTVGGSWHNNHHARPSLASTSRHWWQWDISGQVISLLEWAGLVWNVKRNRAVREGDT